MAAFDKLWMCLYTKLGTLAGFCPLIPKCNKWFGCQVSCVSTTDRPFASLLAKRCLAPSLHTETCCIRTHGKLLSGRYQSIDLRFINVMNVLVRVGASVACNVRLIASQRAVTFCRYDHDSTGSQLQIFGLCSLRYYSPCWTA